ncbi:eCIS core domain-containing protein [Amaricoccus tamworthensis]|uniref:eCIS core domain-containing protein n=1 Tax=Amaricoccus tamworthensis TaxID=57002 RepID=UPI003C7C513F
MIRAARSYQDARGSPAPAIRRVARGPVVPVQMKAGCSCGGGCPDCSAKTSRLEDEAEAAADSFVQRKAAPDLSPAEEEPMQSRDGGAGGGEVPLADPGAGEALPRELAASLGGHFGRDFSGVRVHHDTAAGRSARQLGARAWTLGRDIVFAPGEYAPAAAEGRHLIAHEVAHVVQQGHAPAVPGGVAKPLSPAPRSIQRLCGPSEIGDVPGCVDTGGDIFGEPFLFNVNCDTFRPGEEDRLRGAARDLLGSAATVSVHGFASEDGAADFNRDLSCMRANRAAQILRDVGLAVVALHSHGGVPGEAAERRSVVLDPRSEPAPVPEPVPVEEDRETPAPDPVQCGDFETWVVRTVLNIDPTLLGDVTECLCEFIKLADVMESIAQLVASGIFPKRLAVLIEIADCLCNFWDWLQLVYETGSDGGCWAFENYDSSDFARTVGFFTATIADCFSQTISNWVMDQLGDLLFELLVIEGGAAGSPGGPVGAGGGAVLGAVIAVLARVVLVEKVAEVGDLIADLFLYLSQNQISHGTIFPLDGCRSCGRIPSHFGGPDWSGYCDSANEYLIPKALRVPDWHGAEEQPE